MQTATHRKDRTVLRVSGSDHLDFLQDLVSNNLTGLDKGAVYTALLSPQGKYLFDFFVLPSDDSVLIDVKADRAAALAQRLNMYKLRAKVEISATDLQVVQFFGAAPDGEAFADPRHAEMGWRVYCASAEEILADIAEAEPETALRITHLIPESGIELIPDDSYILEYGFERLNGVDFTKGCYVGQEVVARMKHKTELRKGLAKIALSAPVPVGAPITADGKPVGVVYSNLAGVGLAHLRFDRVTDAMQAGGAEVKQIE